MIASRVEPIVDREGQIVLALKIKFKKYSRSNLINQFNKSSAQLRDESQSRREGIRTKF